MTPIANARMYSVSPSAAAAWNALLAHVIAELDVDMMIMEHNYPHRLDTLWQRDDLGCVFMCGWPFIREGGHKTLLAAPVPDADWAEDRAQYCSEFIVAAEAPYTELEDTFGRRFAFNVQDSHSGYNAPRAHLSRWAEQAPLFSEIVGPFVTHQRVVEAVATHAADIAAIDGFTMLLLRRHAPDLVAGVRVIARTAPCPLPLLVANALDPDQAQRVRETLASLHSTVAGRDLLAEVCTRRFVHVAPDAYLATQAMERAAFAAGYPDIR